MVALPVSFLSLVPSGSVSPALFDVVQAVRSVFPFEASLDAMQGALDSAGPGLATPLLHLAALTLAYGAAARLALRRF
jgi:ABC-2 type transport system permease protein